MRYRRLVAVVGALALGLTACGGGKTPSQEAAQQDKQQQNESPATPQGAGFQVVQDANAKGPAKDLAGAQKGGTATILTVQAPETFDPTRSYYIDTGSVLRLTARTLTALELRPDGKYYLIPDLATDLGRHNADYTEWTFHLKDGLKYEDGSAVTAQDLAYSVKRSFATEELPGGPVYQQSYFLDGGKYKGPFKTKAQGGGLDYPGVSTPDDKTVVMKMAKPFPDLPYYTTFPVFTPIPQAKDTRDAYGNHPLATGPYKFDSYQKGKRLVLVKNDQWDPKTDAARHQYVDKYDFKYGQNPIKLQEQLIADNGPDQTAITYDSVDSSLLPKIQGKEPEKRMMTGDGTCTSFIFMDTRRIPLEVRRALITAWPYDSLHKSGGDNPFTYTPATTILPKVTPGFVNYDLFGNGSKGDGNPTKAKKMLEKAGKLGFDIVWAYSNDNDISAQVSAVRSQKLKAAGFRTTAIPMPRDQVRAELENSRSKINIRPSGWCLDWPSGSTVFPAIFDGRLIALNPASAPVKSFLNAKDINAEIDRISALPLKEQQAEWPKLDKMMMQKYAPVIPVSYSKTNFLYGSKLGGVVLDPFSGGPDFTKLFVKQ
ncbi:peptide/nickel transport system substrate-binding protein [Actinopolymorpha cephalotaxi]|uniref:Peptide/nickel transport system substrate-binding protein n=1 Tax=Actinopolymorpha cephalotaxi TaxID=504797 RepID=A0A1I2LRX2_9ACTN|nr:ABC transporter substrate-binding protein [Actinopolymorpha cephalotaxi]NYH81331.1 peptide/nickel transport system substrate-binding protein [Actinopolymorpha cephalotaxi]SFF79821.1 peptide/nickel transport system substrate-binding protein [Actinopolymorpha cephalotaxi]